MHVAGSSIRLQTDRTAAAESKSERSGDTSLSKSDVDRLWEALSTEVNVDNIWRDAEAFSRWERYTGSEDGEAAVDYIIKRMEEYHVPVRRETYRAYRSLPVSAMVEVLSPEKGRRYAATAAVYSGRAEKLTGEVVYDDADGKKLTPLENDRRFAAFRNKIVLTRSGDPDFALDAKRAGALAVLKIWAYDIYHHWTIGSVWGTPSTEEIHQHSFLPFAELKKNDGEDLLAMVRKGPVTVSIDIEMDNRVVETTMPIARIQGKSDKYVMIAGHYDSWYEGMTDNGAADVILIEMARLFQKHQNLLNRSVVIAWWSGHSDAKFAGSTWYFDRYWSELRENCVGYLYVDIAGCKTSDQVRLRRTGMAGAQFGHEAIRRLAGHEPKPYVPMPRGADQSFFGSAVPITIFTRYEETSFFDENGVQVKPHFYWWHTAADTLDKVSKEIVLRDFKINAKLAADILNSPQIPVDIPFFLTEMERFLREIDGTLSEDFDLSAVYPVVERVREAVSRLTEAGKGRNTDDIIKKVAGELNRLVYSDNSPYRVPPLCGRAVFPGLSKAKGVTRQNSREDYYLFLQSEFLRQRNRLVGQLSRILDDIELQLYRWREEDEGKKASAAEKA